MRKIFDQIKGQNIHSYILENDKIKIEVLDFGARINRCLIKDNNIDVVQGYDSIKALLEGERYMGATIGRVANRIAKGDLTIDGKTYALAKNNNGNTLHGGDEGFESKLFDVVCYDDYLECSYISKHLEENFPGNLELKITYRLLEDGWSYEYQATSDQDTVCSITNHAYFNLNGYDSGSVLNHLIKIEADEYARVDEDGLTLDEVECVDNTPFDFKEFKVIAEHMALEHQQLAFASGFDHNFLIKGNGLRPCATVKGESLLMEVFTTMPCMHFYTANFLNVKEGKSNTAFDKNSSLCLETQYYPNAMQYEKYEKPYLEKGKIMKHCTEFRFKSAEGE